MVAAKQPAESLSRENLADARARLALTFLREGSREYRKIFRKLFEQLEEGASKDEAVEVAFANLDWDSLEEALSSYLSELYTRPQ